MVGIFDPACEPLLPGCFPWTKELYSCTVALPNKMYRQYVAVWGGVGGGVELCCRPYSAVVLRSVYDQIQNLPDCFTTPNKNDQ